VAPSRAIKTQGAAKVVQVFVAGGETETRQVQTGLAGDQVTEIVAGLQPGERLIVSGATVTASASGATTTGAGSTARVSGATGLLGVGVVTGTGTGARPPGLP
jgi:membrane fusion protein, macrolide-specific efflux system